MIYCEAERCQWNINGICNKDTVNIITILDTTPECDDYEEYEDA